MITLFRWRHDQRLSPLALAGKRDIGLFIYGAKIHYQKGRSQSDEGPEQRKQDNALAENSRSKSTFAGAITARPGLCGIHSTPMCLEQRALTRNRYDAESKHKVARFLNVDHL